MKPVGRLLRFTLGVLVLLPCALFADQGGPSTKGFAWADSQDVTFNWLEITSDADVIQLSTSPDVDTVYKVVLPSDFSFDYYGTEFDSFYVSSNGFITFHDYAGNSFQSNNDLSENSPLDSSISIFWDSLGVSAFGGVYYNIKGTAPYRQVVIEFERMIVLGSALNPLTFEIILYETTNLIKFQYLLLGPNDNVEKGSGATIGLKYGGATFDSLLYSFNQAALTDGLAILFYPSDNLVTTSGISPPAPPPGVTPQLFTMSVTGIEFELLADSLENMGKADVLVFSNEMNTATTDPITVTDVRVDGTSFFILESSSSPRELGLEGPFATWFYDNATDSLYIRTTPFAIRDSIAVEFQENTPETPASFDFDGFIYANLEPGQKDQISATITTTANEIASFIFTPAGDSTVAAGDTLSFTIAARDEFGNPVISSETINLTALGSTSALFVPGSSVSFANSDMLTVSVLDTVEGSFVVRASSDADSTIQDVSGTIAVTPAALAELRIRSAAGNLGTDQGGVPQTVTTLVNLQYYAAGYDAYGNYIADIDSVEWDQVGGGTLISKSPFTFPYTGNNFLFDSDTSGTSGQIFISLPNTGGITDTTGLITVNAGPLASLKIQTIETAASSELADTTLVANEVIRLYSVGYDIHGNRRSNVASNWTVNVPGFGSFADSTDVDNVFFTPQTAGVGVIRAIANSNFDVFDFTGLITVNAGAIASITIRNGANNGGTAYETPLVISTDTSLVLYAAGYDALGNYSADTTVSWGSTGLSGVPTNPASSIVYQPTAISSGTIHTAASGVVNDTTATITVVAGSLSTLRVESDADGDGSEVGSMTLVAGADTSLYAVGYDVDGNFNSNVSSNWTIEGNAIGTFSQSNPATFNVFTGETVGSAVVRATQDGGSLSDITSTITVIAGAADSLVYVAASDSQSAPPNGQLPRAIEVQVLDAFQNPVPGVNVTFEPLLGGSVSSTSATTDVQGFAETFWTVHDDTTTDSLAAYITGVDTVYYVALPSAGTADSLLVLSDSTDTGQVNTDADLFRVAVRDSSGRGITGYPITFAIIDQPIGAQNASLTVTSTTTGVNGEASTTLHIGTKVGEYVVRAFTAGTTPNFVTFTATATPAGSDTILVVSGNNQTGPIGTALADSIQVQVVDVYLNPVPGASVVYNALDGSASPVSGNADSNGMFSTRWTLGNSAGIQQLASSVPFSQARSDTILATATAGSAASLELVSMRGISGDSIPAVAGENITVIIEVQDSFGNPVENTPVTFEALSGYNPVFGSSTVTTGSNGQASNFVLTDDDTTQTFFRALIAGVDTLELHVLHLQYAAGSLSPASASPGENVAFSVDIENPALFNVELDDATTLFKFNDGSSFFSASLDNGVTTLSSQSTTTISFNSTQINAAFSNAAYTPKIDLRGATSTLTGTLTLPQNALSLFSVEIVSVSGPGNNQVTPGDNFRVTMNVSNLGPVAVNVDNVVLFSAKIPSDSFKTVIGLPNPTQLPASSTNNLFNFDAFVPLTATAGVDTVDGQFSGTTTTLISVFDDAAATPYPYEVISDAGVSFQALSPTTVSTGQNATLTATLLNAGNAIISLNKDSSYVFFGNDTITLAQTFALPPNSQGAVDVDFGPGIIQTPASSVPYSIRLYGTANSSLFDSTMSSLGTMLVQSIPQVDVLSIDAVADSVAQNQDSVMVLVQLVNVNANSASAIVIEASDIFVATEEPEYQNIQPSVSSQSLFPLTIAGGASSPVIEFVYSLDDDYPVGSDTVRVSYSYTDVNTGTVYSAAPQDTFDTYIVVAPAQLSITSVTTSFDSVSIGASDVPVSVRLLNSGGSSVLVDSLRLTFTAGTYTGNDTIFSPARSIAAGASTTIDLAVSVPGGQASRNQVVINANAYARNQGAPIQDLGADTVDVWQLVSAADLVWQSITPPVISNGQQASFAVSVRNDGEANVRLDAASTNLVIGDGTTIQVTPLSTAQDNFLIEGEAAAILNFNVLTVDGMIPGNLDLELRAINYLENGFLVTDTLNSSDLVVQDSAIVTFDDVTAPATISENMTFSIDLLLGNANVDAATATIDSITVPALGISSSTPRTIDGGNTLLVQLSQFIDTIPPGIVNYDINIWWQDGNIGHANLLTQGGSVEILAQSVLNITAIANPANINTGQSDIPVTISVQNTGAVTALIDTITFVPDVGLYVFDLPSPLDPIEAGQTVDYLVDVSVFQNSGTGLDNIDVTVAGRDSISNNAVADVSSFSWSIEGEANLDIIAVRPSRNQVSRGQNAVDVDVILKNNGSVSVRIDSVALNFENGNSNYTNTDTSGTGLLTLGPNVQDTVTIAVSVNADAQLGADEINASAEGVDLFTGNTLTVSSANSTGSWDVQQRPVVEFPSLTLSKDVVSTGQQDIILSFGLKNNGGASPTATAQVDSIRLLVNGVPNDTSEFDISAQFTTPVTLVNTATLNFNYTLDVKSDAASGDYIFAIDVDYRDANDNSSFNVQSPDSSTDTLTVQQRSTLSVREINFVPDTAYVGQDDVEMTVSIVNNGEGTAQLNSTAPRLEIASYPVSLQTIGFPFTLPQGDSIDILYDVTVPDNLIISGVDTISAGAFLQWLDVNSSTILSSSEPVDTTGELFVVNQAELAFIDLTPVGPFDIGENVLFTMTVQNIGGASIVLNNQTQMRWDKVGDPNTSILIPLDIGASDLTILAGETTTLVFEDTPLNESGDFRITLEVRGTVYGEVFPGQDLDTGIFENVGGDIFIQSINIDPNPASPGQSGISVDVVIVNQSSPVSIDSLLSVLTFRYQGGDLLEVVPIRVDALDSIGTTTDTMMWVFNLPADAAPGLVDVTASLSFNNGTIGPVTQAELFEISSGVQVAFVPGSIDPDSVVQGERLSLRASFVNNGSSNFLVGANSSLIEFTDGTHIYTATVNGNFALPGADDPFNPDTSDIVFKINTVDSLFTPGDYAVRFKIFGELPNGDTLTAFDANTAAAELTVLEDAEVELDSVSIVPATVIAGQNGIEIRYFLSNTGQSNASIASTTATFVDANDIPVTSQWTRVYSSKGFPFLVGAGDTAIVIQRFNLSQASNTGLVFSSLTGTFNDVLKSTDTRIFADPLVRDSVNVIVPSSISIDSLKLVNVPNAANGTVNTDQPYDLKLIVRNMGEDAVTSIAVNLFENDILIEQHVLADTIGSGMVLDTTLFDGLSDSNSGSNQYRAVLTSAISVTSGEAVSIGSPLDNLETVLVQVPSLLTLGGSSSDLTPALGQTFTVSFSISRASGTSPVDSGAVILTLPSNYSLPGGISNIIDINNDTLSGAWQVTADAITTDPNGDTLMIGYATAPIDLNTGLPMNQTNMDVELIVVTDTTAGLRNTVSIESPPGAQDSILSSGQSFTLASRVIFSGNIDSLNRSLELVLPANFSVDGSRVLNLTGKGNIVDTTWTVNVPQTFPSGESRDLVVVAKGRDADFFTDVLDSSFLSITVVDKASLNFSAAITAPSGAVDGTVSTLQSFVWALSLTNVGVAGVNPSDSTVVALNLDDTGIWLDAGFTSSRDTLALLPDSTAALTLFVEADAQVSTMQASVIAVSVDENTGDPALINTTLIEKVVQIKKRADLTMALSGPTALDTSTTTFQVVGLVKNIGEAGITPAQVEVVLDTTGADSLQLTSGNLVSQVTLNAAGEGTVTYDFTALGVSEDNQLVADISADAAADENSGQPAFKSKPADTLNISIVSDVVQILSLEISEPAGAQDSIVSTGQDFTIEAGYFYTSTADSSGRLATITVPPGYSVTPASIPLVGDFIGVVSWQVNAPDTASGPAEISVLVSGKFVQDTVSAFQALTVQTVERAALAVNSAIAEPSGAADNVLSTSQFFDLEVSVDNLGTAGTIPGSLSEVQVVLPAGFVFENGSGIDTLTIATGGGDTVRIQAPDAAAAQRIVESSFISTALDENTNDGAAVADEVDEIALTVVARADLSVGVSAASVFSTGQDSVAVDISVNNLGTAGVVPDSVRVTLGIDPAFLEFVSTEVDSPYVHLVNSSGTATIYLNVLTTPGSTSIQASIVDADAQDENNNYADTLAFVSLRDSVLAVQIDQGGLVSVDSIYITSPAGAVDDTLSNGQRFSLKAELSYSGNISDLQRTGEIFLPPGFSLVADTAQKPVQVDNTIEWDIVIDDTVALAISDRNKTGGAIAPEPAPVERAGGKTVRGKMLPQSAKGGAEEAAPGRKVTGSADEAVAFGKPVEGGKITLQPDDIIQELLGVERTLTVEGAGLDAGSGDRVTDQASHLIQVEKQASLAINAEIAAPAGAFDGVISTGQPVDIRVWVNSAGEAQVSGLNQVILTVPAGFSIAGSSGDSLFFSLGTGVAEDTLIRIFAPAEPGLLQVRVKAILDTAALDENSGEPANIETASETISLLVQSAALLSLTDLAVFPDSVGTDNLFSLIGTVRNLGNAAVGPNNEIWVELTFDESNISLINPADTLRKATLVNTTAQLTWQLQAGGTLGVETLTTRLLADSSYDANGFPDTPVDTLVGTLSKNIEIIEDGTVAITDAYLGQSGITSRVVSTGQSLRVVAKLAFTGLLVDTTATLLLPDVFAQQEIERPVIGDSVVWDIGIPEQVTSGFVEMQVVIEAVSFTQETLTAADTLSINIDAAARLVLSGGVTGGTLNNTVSFGQTFTYQAVVANLGEAGLDADPPGQLTLELGDSLQLESGSAIADFEIDTPVNWTIRADTNTIVSALQGEINTLKAERKLIFHRAKTAIDGSGEVISGGRKGAPQASAPQPATLKGKPQSAKGGPGGGLAADSDHIGKRLPADLAARTSVIDAEINKLYGQLSTHLSQSFVKVSISAVPLDVNSGEPADTLGFGGIQTNIEIAAFPEISIDSVLYASTVSTGQISQITVTLNAPANVIDRFVTLKLPAPFVTPGDSVHQIGRDSTTTWTITAPSQIDAQINGTMTVVVGGRDENNASVTVGDTMAYAISVQQAAALDISLTGSSTRQVPKGEAFPVRIQVDRLGEAELSGPVTVVMSNANSEFQLISDDTVVVTDLITSRELVWNLIAPESNTSSTELTIKFVDIPEDVNTGNPVQLINNDVRIFVSVIANQLIIDTFKVAPPIVNSKQGATNIALIGITFTNPDPVKEVHIESFLMSVRENLPDSLTSDVSSILTGIRVVSRDFYESDILSASNNPDIFGEIVPGASPNPFNLPFNIENDTINAGETSELVLLIDVPRSALNRTFEVRLEDVDAFDNDAVRVSVVDADGVVVSRLGPRFTSPIVTVISDDPLETFRNYPNPFGLDTQIPGAPRGVTRFSFALEQDSDVQLRVYTLLGKLVYMNDAISLPAGDYSQNEVTWDGRNGQGRYVVNGVYVAVLRVIAGGQSTDFTSKVVFIK